MKAKTAFCFDLDGTITKEEILPLLAKKLDLFDEIQALTMATINGFIPFESSFKLRTMILSQIPISQIQDIVVDVKLHHQIVEFIQQNRENCFIVTGNLDVWLEKLLSKLRIQAITSIAHYDKDRLIGVSKILNKGDAINEIRQQGFDRIISVGDGMGDVNMFNQSNISIAYGGVHKPVQTLIELSDILTFKEESLCRTLNTLL